MKRARWVWSLAVLGAALVGLYLWFFVEVPKPAGDFRIDIQEIRRLAQSIPGARPAQIRVERVARFKFPGAVGEAGQGWGFRPLEVLAYQLVFPSGTAIVDTALDEAAAKSLLEARFDAAAFDRVGRALSRAGLIVVTHEHADHLGGLVVQPNLPQLLKAAKLNEEQVRHPELLEPAKFPPHALDGYQPIQYARYLAVAPGVVLIRAPGHTPGSQLVYVQRQDGAEYLFLGDVAWRWHNVLTKHERPRAVALMMKEDRPLVTRELEELNGLGAREPQLHQIPGHDPEVIDALISSQLLQQGFTVGTSTHGD